MCIGNRDGGDDAIGPYIADRLMEKSNDFVVIDCGVVPENFTSVVKRHNPKNLIIIDATEMNLEPGAVRIVPKEKIGTMHISTHGIPISVLIKYLEKYVENIIFIGLQPKNMIGELTDIMKKSGDELIQIMLNKEIEKIKKL
jgi:hydrogenase 3 maturation protease